MHGRARIDTLRTAAHGLRLVGSCVGNEKKNANVKAHQTHTPGYGVAFSPVKIPSLTGDGLQTAADDEHVDLVDAEEQQEEQDAEEDEQHGDADEERRRAERVGQYRREVLERAVADALVSERDELAQPEQSDVSDARTSR